MRNKMIHLSLAASVSLVFAASQAQADTVVLPLGPIHTGADILNYYDGGNDSVPSDGTGPNLGIVFSSNATAQKAGSNQATGDGKFENNPSGQSEILYYSFSNTIGSYLNYASGFTGLSFNYSYSNNSGAPETVSLYSGLNGTGTLLNTLALTPAAVGTSCSVRTDAYCTWSTATTLPLSLGAAESALFSTTAASTGSPTTVTEFDGVTLTTAPVPLPASAWMMLSGLGFLGAARRRRKVAG